MSIYKRGSTGEEVKKIQRKLKKLGYYRGPIDGIFGGGTESAVKNFQRDNGLVVDGIVGSKTWKALFGKSIKKSSILKKDLLFRCLALTGTFETGKGFPDCFAGITGDFDGQGISFGVLQWNFGQGSLQPLLRDMIENHRDVISGIFNEYFPLLETVILSENKEDEMVFARLIQHPVKHFIYEPWRGMFKTLGRTEEFQEIQMRYSQDLFNEAVEMVEEYRLWSERAVALMFDIKVQNGSIGRITKEQIFLDFEGIKEDLSEEEKEIKKMEIIANRRAEASNPRWIEDVRSRKLCIARGYGVVHGMDLNIESQFGIKLKPFKEE
ncbi:peptidoglycan-binding domain-containing protein [Persephonella sp.]